MCFCFPFSCYPIYPDFLESRKILALSRRSFCLFPLSPLDPCLRSAQECCFLHPHEHDLSSRLEARELPHLQEMCDSGGPSSFSDGDGFGKVKHGEYGEILSPCLLKEQVSKVFDLLSGIGLNIQMHFCLFWNTLCLFYCDENFPRTGNP